MIMMLKSINEKKSRNETIEKSKMWEKDAQRSEMWKNDFNCDKDKNNEKTKFFVHFQSKYVFSI